MTTWPTTSWSLRLLYYPDGAPFVVVLDRVTGGWRPRR
jgi:hypothetical protein